MSKKEILVSAHETLCPSQVYLEKTPSHVLDSLFCVGSENDAQETEEPKSSTQSPSKRPKTKTKSGAKSGKRNRPAIARKKVHVAERDGKPAQKKLVLASSNPNVPKPARSMSIVGTALTPRPRSASHFRDVPASPCAKPSSLVKTPTSWEVDNGKKACILTAIKPCNVDKERIKFFKSEFSYNPRFEYTHPVSPIVLAQHNSASDRFLTQVSGSFALVAPMSLKSCFTHVRKKERNTTSVKRQLKTVFHPGGQQSLAQQHWRRQRQTRHYKTRTLRD